MLCKRYLRSFGVLRQIDPDAGEQRYTALKRSLYEKVPYLDRLLDRYYEKQVSTDEIARVIAVYERRAPQIESALKYL